MPRAAVHPDSLRGQGLRVVPTAAPAAPPGVPPEPKWDDYFPRKAQAHMRRRARREWKYLLAELDRANIVVSRLDLPVLEDYVVCRVRLIWLESWLSSPEHMTDRGASKDAVFSPLNQYRAQLKFYIDRLGLSPRSRQDLKQTRSADEGGFDLD